VFELFLFALGGIAVWVFLKFRAAAQKVDKWERLLAGCDYQQAGEHYLRVAEIIKEHFRQNKNSKYGANEVGEIIECAVACQNRMNQVMGEEHGPQFRAKIRTRLIASLAYESNIIRDGY